MGRVIQDEFDHRGIDEDVSENEFLKPEKLPEAEIALSMLISNHQSRDIILCSLQYAFVSLGAGIIVLLLAFDPFIQQIINYPIQSSLSTNGTESAFAPQQRNWLPGSNSYAFWNDALGQALWGNAEFLVAPHCSSGDCKWDVFSSIGICSHCRDVTTIVRLDCDLPTLNDMEKFKKRCNIILPPKDEKEKLLSIGNFDIIGFNTSLFPAAGNETSNITPHGEKSASLSFPPRIYSQFQHNIDYEPDRFYLDKDFFWAGVENPLWPIAYSEISMVYKTVSANESMDKQIQMMPACVLSHFA